MEDNNFILPTSDVKAYRFGNKLELSDNIGNSKPVRKISKTEYMDLNGEIHEYANVSENRSDNKASLVKTMKRLGRYIEHNFDGSNNELWITLTYKENVTDSKRVYEDYKAFMKKIRRHYGHVEYICILEPQKRGAWHVHALFKSYEYDYFFIPNDRLRKIWKHGFVNVKKLKHSDNVAAYVTAYLTDLKHDNKAKSIEKGARLHLYPAGMNFYRMSRGIQKPLEMTGSKVKVFKEYGITNSVYSPDKYYEHEVEKTDKSKMIYKREFYNLKGGRKK